MASVKEYTEGFFNAKMTKFACEVWRRGDEIQGYVRYQTVEAAASAVSSWHNSWYCEFKLSVEFARRG